MLERWLLSWEVVAQLQAPSARTRLPSTPRLSWVGGDFLPWLSGGDAWALPSWHGLEGGCPSGLALPLGVKIPPQDSNAS